MPRARSIAQIERDAQFLELRRRGLSYRQIAAQMLVSSQKTAYEAVQRALKDAIQEPADEVRQIELDRLDELMRHALRVLATPHYVVSQIKGEVITFLDVNGTDKPVVDDAPILAAIDRLLKISERRAKLLGLDAPTRTRIEVITEDAVDAAIADLEREIAEHDRAAAGRGTA